MVYRGKPSAACAECRKRRSRCDYAVPACGQCRKTGRICSGYRNMTDLMFHDESGKIARQNAVRPRENYAASPICYESKDGAKAMIHGKAKEAVRLTDFILYQPVGDLGINFLMSTYIGNNPTGSILYYLPKFYSNKGYVNAGLQQSIVATGLAGFAKSSSHHEVIEVATKSYTSAIRGINVALSDQSTAVQDSTLVSIIMMAMYEVLVSPSPSALHNVTRHLEGGISVALLSLDLRPQTGLTRQVLMTLIHSVLINCWTQTIPLPANLRKLTDKVAESGMLSTTQSSFLDVVLELVQLRSVLQRETSRLPADVIYQALAIDNKFKRFADDLVQADLYECFHVPAQNNEHLVYKGSYHVYNDRFTAPIWDNIRPSQLYLHHLILQQLDPEPNTPRAPPSSSQASSSRTIITELATEIIASVPQIAGTLDHIMANFVPV